MPNPWIADLVLVVKMQLLCSTTVSLEAKRFFPELVAQDYKMGVCTYPKTRKVFDHVEVAITFWPQFHPRPGMSLPTSRAVATFISIEHEAFGSLNFLYLNHIQQGIRTLRALLTDERIGLADMRWERLSEEPKPLNSPQLGERPHSRSHSYAQNIAAFYPSSRFDGGDYLTISQPVSTDSNLDEVSFLSSINSLPMSKLGDDSDSYEEVPNILVYDRSMAQSKASMGSQEHVDVLRMRSTSSARSLEGSEL